MPSHNNKRLLEYIFTRVTLDLNAFFNSFFDTYYAFLVVAAGFCLLFSYNEAPFAFWQQFCFLSSLAKAPIPQNW